MRVFRILLLVTMIFAVLTPVNAVAAWQFGARLPEPEELDRVIDKITRKQSKNLKAFEVKVREYFFDTHKKETVASVVGEFPPGEAVAVLVLSDLSKKPGKDLAAMRKSGKSWPEIAELAGTELKAVIKEVKAFRTGIG